MYDPKVGAVQIQSDLNYLETRSEASNSEGVHVYDNPYEACKDAHAIAVLTEWDEFKAYDWQKNIRCYVKTSFCF